MILWVAVRKELLQGWRTYRWLVTLVVLVAMGMSSPLLARLTPELIRLLPNGDEIARLIPPPTATDAVAQYIKNMNQFGILLAVLLAMGAVADEREKGTAAMVLSKPMPRSAFLLAKFVALAGVFAVAFSLAGLACWYYTSVLFAALDPARWLALNALLLVLCLVYVATTLLCSTLARSQTAAGGMAIGLLVLVAAVEAIPTVGRWLPGQLLNWAAALMDGRAVPGLGALGVSLGMIVVSLLAAWAVLERQEV